MAPSFKSTSLGGSKQDLCPSPSGAYSASLCLVGPEVVWRYSALMIVILGLLVHRQLELVWSNSSFHGSYRHQIKYSPAVGSRQILLSNNLSHLHDRGSDH